MRLEFFVRNRKLTRKEYATLIADTAACDTFIIRFDKEWDNLVKIVELKNGKNVVQVLYTGETPLPAQVCGRGDLYLSCHGYRQKEDTVAVVRTIPMIRPVRLVGSENMEPNAGQPDVPSAYAQMAAVVGEAKAAEEACRRATEELLALKQAGAFQGAPGTAPTVSIGSVSVCPPDGTAKVYATGTGQNIVLNFVLPKGADGQWTQQTREELVQAVLQALPLLDEVSY